MTGGALLIICGHLKNSSIWAKEYPITKLRKYNTGVFYFSGIS